MQGFDTKALLLFPMQEFLDEKQNNYRYLFQTAVKNMTDYLRSVNIEPHAFITDDTARALPDNQFKFISTLTTGDLFFISKNCEGMANVMQLDMVRYDDICNKIAELDELPRNLSTEDRFEHVLNRNKKAITSIIPSYNVVVNFYKKGATEYRVVVKQNGGKIRIIVDLDTFVLKAYINNVEENPIDLLGIPYASKSLTTWGGLI